MKLNSLLEPIIMPLYTEDDVQYALRDVVNGKSVRMVSLDWGVPRGTLQHKILDTLPKKEAFANLQRLAPVQKKRLTDWVLV